MALAIQARRGGDEMRIGGGIAGCGGEPREARLRACDRARLPGGVRETASRRPRGAHPEGAPRDARCPGRRAPARARPAAASTPTRTGRGGAAADGSARLVIVDGPVDRPISPDCATSTNAGRQSSTMGGSGREAISAGPFTGPFAEDDASGASQARNAARMSSRTDCAAKAVSAAASEAGASEAGRGIGHGRAAGEGQARGAATGRFMARLSAVPGGPRLRAVPARVTESRRAQST